MVETNLILLIIIGIQTPFLAFGIYKIIDFVWKAYRVKTGYVLTRVIKGNKREQEKFYKPTGKGIKTGELERQFDTTKLTFKGNTPIITYIEGDMIPLDLADIENRGEFEAEDVSNIAIRAYNLGVIAGTNITRKIDTLLIVIIILASLGTIAGLYNAVIMHGMDTVIQAIPDTVTGAVTNAIGALSNIQTNVPV